MEIYRNYNTGDRVRIVIPHENLAFGAGKEYPHLGMGMVVKSLQSPNRPIPDKEGLVDVRLKCPFKKPGEKKPKWVIAVPYALVKPL